MRFSINMGNSNKPLNYALLFLLWGIYSCKTIPSYFEKNSPVWTRNNHSASPESDDSKLKVVSFNLELGKKTDLAISELKSSDNFKLFNVLLLQEVDENAVTAFAHAFNMNYLYYPISINPKNHTNYGNAILTLFRLSKELKIILPYAKWTNGRKRSATSAIIRMADKTILVYSVHTETLAMSKLKRRAQIQFLIADIKQNAEKVDGIILGGDFNTLLQRDLDYLRSSLSEIGINWSSSSIGWSSKAFFGLIKPSNDHIFSKGLKLIKAEKLVSSKASDHLPVYVEFSF